MAVKLLLESTQKHVRNVTELREYLRKLILDDFNVQKQAPEVFYKKVFLKVSQNSQENTCARISFLIKLQACTFIKKETLAHMFS